LGGDTHFDEAEPWTLNKAAYNGKNYALYFSKLCFVKITILKKAILAKARKYS